MLYVIPPVFSSWPLSPTSLYLLLPSPPLRPRTLTPNPSHLLGWYPPTPTISEQPSPPESTPSSSRGSELSASQYIARPFSSSLICKPLFPQIPPPPLLLPELGITSPPPPASLYVSLLYALLPRVGNFPGPVPYRGSEPTYMTQKAALHVPPSWKTPPTPLGYPPTTPVSS